MKAVRLHAYGDVDQFKVEDAPTPTPGQGEILIKVEASAINHLDLYARQGFVKDYYPINFPAALGADAAGTVAAVGPGVSGFAVGDRVIGHTGVTGKGTHAEYVVLPVAGVAKLPANVSFEAGATLPLVGLTGYQAVDALNVQRGARVLVSGALGGVGRVAVQYLKELGAKPVAGVLPDQLAEARAFAGEALDLTQEPSSPSFDYAVSTAGPAAAAVVKYVRDGGTVASVAMTPPDANPGGRVKVIPIMHHDDPDTLRKVAEKAGRGELSLPIAQTFRLEELGKAHKAMAAGVNGKIVLKH